MGSVLHVNDRGAASTIGMFEAIFGKLKRKVELLMCAINVDWFATQIVYCSSDDINISPPSSG